MDEILVDQQNNKPNILQYTLPFSQSKSVFLITFTLMVDITGDVRMV